jgi:polyisoprenoid-binding protein YceI
MAMKLLLAAILASASAGAAAQGVRYEIDPAHTVVLASWSHLGYSHPSANFTGAHGAITYDAQAPAESSVQVAIPMAGIDTFVPELDTHLKGAEFFDVASFPEATFASTGVRDLGAGKLEVSGNLTLHGVTRPVVLLATLNKAAPHPMGNVPTIGFDATTTLKRSDFGVSNGIPFVGDDIALRITTEAGAAQ